MVSNISWIVGCRVVQALLSLVITMFTARYLGPSNYGIINYAASIVAFIAPLVNLGLTEVMVQKLVSHPEDEGKILGTATTLGLISSILGILGITAFAAIMNPGEKETVVVCLLYSISLIFRTLENIRYWYQAKLMSRYSSVIGLIAYVVISVYRVALLIGGMNVRWFALAQSIDYAVTAVVLFVLYKKKGGAPFAFSGHYAKRLLKSGKYYILSGLMVSIFAQTDKLMIKPMLGADAAGFYAAAVTCASMTSFVFSAILDSVSPVIYESKKTSSEKFEKNVTGLYSVIIWLSLIQCLLITVFSKEIIYIIYGDAYAPAVNALRIIVWYTTFSYLGAVRNIWMLAENKQKYLWSINLAGALANVALNTLMIPKWGINGAALASLITQIFTNVIVGAIFKPIRRNNLLMLKALNPRVLRELFAEREEKQ